jgi:hypothetical protein
MNTVYLTKVRGIFNNSLAPRHTNRHNMRGWVKSVRFLGGKWLGLTIHIEKIKCPN